MKVHIVSYDLGLKKKIKIHILPIHEQMNLELNPEMAVMQYWAGHLASYLAWVSVRQRNISKSIFAKEFM